MLLLVDTNLWEQLHRLHEHHDSTVKQLSRESAIVSPPHAATRHLCSCHCQLGNPLDFFLSLQDVAIGSCNHKAVCAECCLKQRECYSDKKCPLCKAEQHQVRQVTLGQWAMPCHAGP